MEKCTPPALHRKYFKSTKDFSYRNFATLRWMLLVNFSYAFSYPPHYHINCCFSLVMFCYCCLQLYCRDLEVNKSSQFDCGVAMFSMGGVIIKAQGINSWAGFGHPKQKHLIRAAFSSKHVLVPLNERQPRFRHFDLARRLLVMHTSMTVLLGYNGPHSNECMSKLVNLWCRRSTVHFPYLTIS